MVSRPRLIQQLNTGIDSKLTLISAPAGYGKSTLLSEWVQQVGAPVAWLSLDAYDNDPTRFWTYIEATLGTILPLGETKIDQNLLQSHRQSSPDNLLSDLIVEIARITERVVLVLDDLHLVTDPQIHDGLMYLMEYLPATPGGLHLVIASRMDPPWALARLRVNGEIIEVRAKDLRFTPDEAASFLNQVMHLTLSPHEISELDQRTEGWVAGLQMAALSMRGRSDISRFLEGFSGSHRFVLDYLMEEVLSQQSLEIMMFLTQTAILTRLTGPLCDAVTRKPGGQEILQHLETSNMFLVPLDDERVWYRYHPLFRDLLRKRLQETNPGHLPTLHRRASHWYDQSGLAQEAIIHALAARDYELAADMLEHHALDLIQRGEMTLTRQWLQSLPDDIIRPRPVLCIAQAWTSVRYSSVEFAEELLALAEAALKNVDDVQDDFDPTIRGLVTRQIAVLQVVIARARGESTQKQQDLALEALGNSVTMDDHASQAWLLYRLGLCYIDLGKDNEADHIFSQAYEHGINHGNYYAAHAASYGRMVIARRRGRLHELAAICHQTLEASSGKDDQNQSLIGIPTIMLGYLLYEWNNLVEAERYLTEGLKWVKQAGMAEIQTKGNFALACLKIAMGDTGAPLHIQNQGEEGHPGLRAYASALQARVNLLRAAGNTVSPSFLEAVYWAETQQLALKGKPFYDWEIYEKLVYARVLCTRYQAQPNPEKKARLEEFLAFIKEQLQPLEALDWKGLLVEVYAVMAVILQTLDKTDRALTMLERTIALAEPEGFVRTLVDEGEPMHHLLQRYVSTRTGRFYAHKLLSFFEARTPGPMLVDPLNKREMQVLQLLSTHLSVPEIASEIHLAPTTIRTHVKNIYRKLGVHGRLAAIQKAEEIGL